jgi:pyruvate, water dikinase
MSDWYFITSIINLFYYVNANALNGENMATTPLIRWLNEVCMRDLALVGGKNASLGEMIQNLDKARVRVPNGFALTTEVYKKYLTINNIQKEIFELLYGLNPLDLTQLGNTSLKIKEIIKNASFDQEMVEIVQTSYEQLRHGKNNLRVAVRSSASTEDLPNASFAGQQDTYLHVASFDELMMRIKDVYASLFGERAIAYRAHNGFNHKDVLISVGVQEMINSDSGTSGVMFSLDPESGFKDCVFINSGFGLGEAIVSGSINPDEFMIYKPAVRYGRLVTLHKKLGSKAKKLIFSPDKKKSLMEVPVEEPYRNSFSLNSDDLLELSHCACLIEEHYKRPMDIEWAKDGITNEIFILQARPETVHSNQEKASAFIYHLEEEGRILCEGRAVGKNIGQGKARVLKNIDQARNFRNGEVLVTDMTDPNWEPIMQKASAIVTNRGGRTCHAAIIARELGIAAVVGCHNATSAIKDSTDITVSCALSDIGQVYDGLLKFSKKQQVISQTKSVVPLMLIAANPSRAFNYHRLPHQGIGLARLEFIIANSIGIHPNAILKLDDMPNDIKKEIMNRTSGFSSPENFYIETLSLGISSLAAVANPYPIIVRLSDFKTNEYEELLGGSHFEHKENNPMLGFRGASRYISNFFRDAFRFECLALKRAREELGFSNIQVMVPFVRTIYEAENVIKELEKNGLKRGQDGLKIIMMCEVPSNVILADLFLDYFDGFSIGSNDLTQLTLGVDRDSHLVAGQFSESDPAMLKMLEQAISACKDRKKYVGICGQGPSDDINLARWLIEKGIDSLSLTPDTLADVHEALSN